MKNYEEVAQEVFKRRDEYKVKIAKRRKRFKNSLATFCCLSIVAMGGFLVWQNGLQEATENSPMEYGDLSGGVVDSLTQGNYEDVLIGGAPIGNDEAALEGEELLDGEAETVLEEKQDGIIINELDNISSDRQNICLLVEDFVVMDKAELIDYYGINVFPDYPADLKEWEVESGYGIYKREKGTGEVYWDGIAINYSNEDFSRSLNVEVEKGSLPFTCIADFSKIKELSVINGTEVGLGKDENGYYFAEMICEGVGFRIITYGLSEEEFVSVIKSLIK